MTTLDQSQNTPEEDTSPPNPITTTRFWHRKLTLTGHASPDTPVPRMIAYMIVDVGTYMLTIVSFYYLLTRYLILPVERGFYCGDASIRRPFIENTISTTLLLIITLFIPYWLIFIDFWIRKDLHSHGRSLLKSLWNPSFQTCRSTCYVYLDYVLSFGILTYSLEIVKCLTGRLRPNFIQLCRPTTLHECKTNPMGYVPTFECQNTFKHARNSRLSFPSGHAAASVFVVLFLIYFLKRTERQILAQKNMVPNEIVNLRMAMSKLYRNIIIFIYSCFCIVCCATRVLDNWHFMSDVIGGSLFALLLFFILLKSYTRVPVHQHID